MSQYITFAIKHNEEFLPLLDYSRSSAMYTHFANYLTYGKIVPIKDKINKVKERIKDSINSNTKYLDTLKDKMQYLSTSIISYEELSQAWRDYIEDKQECETMIEELEFCMDTLNILEEIQSNDNELVVNWETNFTVEDYEEN